MSSDAYEIKAQVYSELLRTSTVPPRDVLEISETVARVVLPIVQRAMLFGDQPEMVYRTTTSKTVGDQPDRRLPQKAGTVFSAFLKTIPNERLRFFTMNDSGDVKYDCATAGPPPYPDFGDFIDSSRFIEESVRIELQPPLYRS